MTISGITSEMKINVEYPDRPVNLKRVSANAASVPITVARMVAMMATFSVLRNACNASWLWKSAVYQRVDTPVQSVPLRALLKLNTTSTMIGRNKNANARIACSLR